MSETKPRISAIVAMTPDRVIGKNGTLPWHLPEDLQVFKKITTGYPIVMGRKTFESIGRPLPKRRNIVITRDKNWNHEGVEVIHETSELSKLTLDEDLVFIIGGSEIYKAFLPHLNELYVSEVHQKYEGDTYFPEFEKLFDQKKLIEEFRDFTLVKHVKENS